ncbi:hypothetical protein [Methanomassiliicoccus luminyensis]|jgi:hypothetical protein|uniref:hypothetical protein n=1 Tax=Methanomassiliicoccus luminyensis TaxID=1080712 RepID=UPI00036AEADC|nr:hypothetical protein [Methanomassiliicoccus luminyensis]
MTDDQKYPEQPLPEQYPPQYPADQPAYQQYPQYPQQYPQPPVRQRPLGVTILAILEILGGLGSLALAGIFFIVSAVLGSASTIAEIEQQTGVTIPEELLDIGAALFGALGIMFLVVMVLFFVLAWAFFKGKSWARIVAIILLAFSVITAAAGAIASFDIVTLGLGIVIPVIVVVYLYMPEAKTWFTQ